MTEETLTFLSDDAIIERGAADEDQRRITLRLVKFGEVTGNTIEGIRETVSRGAFKGTDPSRVVLESMKHNGTVVGVAESVDEDDIEARATFRVANTPAGDELLTLVKEGILRAASFAASIKPNGSKHRADGVIERVRLGLRSVAILPEGAYPSATILAVREAAESTNEETPPMEDNFSDRFDAIDARLATIEVITSTPRSTEVPMIYRFANFGSMVKAAAADPELARLWADQLTTDDNDGVMRPGWINDVKGIVSTGRRAIDAFGGPKALPESGMSVNWPVLVTPDGEPIAVQSTEKTEIQSVKVEIDDATTAIATYAGGSDLALQLIERSSPSYLESYARIMLASWAKVTDAAFAAGAYAASTGDVTYNLAGDTTGATLLSALFEASLEVEAATGSPAEFVLVSSSVFQSLPAKTAIFPTMYGAAPSVGTADASSLRINASGLPIIHVPGLAAGVILVSNRSAASWLEAGPYQISAPDVQKLGRDVAFWSMGAGAFYVPAGIVQLA